MLMLWANETSSKADMIDLVIIEMMLSTLSDPKFQSWVRVQNLTSIKDACHIEETTYTVCLKWMTVSKAFLLERYWTVQPQRPHPLANFPKLDTHKRDSASTTVRGPLFPNFDPVKGPHCSHCHKYGHVVAKCLNKTYLVSIVNLTLLFVTSPGSINGKEVRHLLPMFGKELVL